MHSDCYCVINLPKYRKENRHSRSSTFSRASMRVTTAISFAENQTIGENNWNCFNIVFKKKFQYILFLLFELSYYSHWHSCNLNWVHFCAFVAIKSYTFSLNSFRFICRSTIFTWQVPIWQDFTESGEKSQNRGKLSCKLFIIKFQ
jgi:hypothetical protein